MYACVKGNRVEAEASICHSPFHYYAQLDKQERYNSHTPRSSLEQTPRESFIDSADVLPHVGQS